FFSSRRRHTRFSRDWSSDVCSSDLVELDEVARRMTVTSPTGEVERFGPESSIWTDAIPAVKAPSTQVLGGHAAVTANSTACAWRSEERRVGESVERGGRRVIIDRRT